MPQFLPKPNTFQTRLDSRTWLEMPYFEELTRSSKSGLDSTRSEAWSSLIYFGFHFYALPLRVAPFCLLYFTLYNWISYDALDHLLIHNFTHLEVTKRNSKSSLAQMSAISLNLSNTISLTNAAKVGKLKGLGGLLQIVDLYPNNKYTYFIIYRLAKS